jgi:hypothetical protein
VSFGITIQSHVLIDTEVLYACLTQVVHLWIL